MASYLRPTAHLGRVSRRSLESATRATFSPTQTAWRPQRISCAPCGARHYASQKDSKKDKPKKDVDRQPGKSAPGMESLYGKNSPLSNNSVNTQKADQEPESTLSPEDEKTLDELSELIQRGMPASQRNDFRAAVKSLRQDGIPPDLRDVMEIFRGNKSLDLATAARVVRITTRLARKAAEHDVAGEGGKQKGGAHDAGPGSSQQGQGSGGGQKSNNNSNSSFNFKVGNYNMDAGTILTTAFVSFMLYRSVFPGENSRDITWQEFRTQFFDRGLVQKLTVVNRNRVKVTLDQNAVRSYYPDSPAAHGGFHFYFSIGDVATFERHLDDAHAELAIPSSQRIPVSYTEETPWAGIMLSWLPTLVLIGATYWLLRRQGGGSGGGSGGGIFGMGRSRAKKFNHETDVKVSFKDVAGMDEAKQEITEFVSFLKEPEQYSKLGAKIPRGAILSGPPGTGKTLLAKATAGESQVPFFSVSGSEFVEMFVGVGASRVRDLFQNARKNAPCIIFIDEIDAIGKSRGKNVASGGNDEREATLNQILTEMDGFSTSEQVVVLAGTNRQDVLDPALLRPGRFDRHINIDRPTMDGRKQIFAVHLRNIVTKEDQEYLRGRLAALTPGFSGADIANCVNEAALIAARYKASDVTMAHFEAAIERVIGGLERKSLVLNPEEKKTVAYHEAGHAICGWFFKYADPLLKVSIIPRGQGALGYAQYLPSGDTYLMNVNQLMDRMAMTLGGRVSEELHFSTVTSGASDDFNKVTRMATKMVTKWGMSDKIGYLYFEDDSQQQLHKPFSEETAKNIDSEVRRIVDEAYNQCKDLLSEKKKETGLVAKELLSKEVLGREDMIRLLGKRPFEDSNQ